MSNRCGDNLMHAGANQRLVAALVAEGVRFIVIGGLAMSWHCPEREADDLDVLLDNSEQNDDRISNALVQLGFNRPPEGKFLSPGVQMPLKHEFYADLLTPQIDSPSFNQCYADSLLTKLFDIPVRVASINTLIVLKEHAIAHAKQGCDKHVGDLTLLRKAAA